MRSSRIAVVGRILTRLSVSEQPTDSTVGLIAEDESQSGKLHLSAKWVKDVREVREVRRKCFVSESWHD